MKAVAAQLAGARWVRVALWLLLTCGGWVLSQAVPPMQSPDENHHIARAYLLGHGVWGLAAPPGKMSGGEVDAGLTAYIRQNMLMAGKPDFRFSAEEQAQLRQLTWQHDTARPYFEMPGTAYYLPLIYVPHALALRLSEALGLRIHTSYQVTRFTVLGATLALMMWACALLRPGMAVLGFVLLPMTLFQLVLPTLDGITTALAMVTVALFARLLQSSQSSNAQSDSCWSPVLLGFCLLLVITTRMHLLPLAAMFFMLAWRCRRWSYAVWGMAVFLIAAVWLAVAVGSTVDTRIPRHHTTTELLKTYVLAPFDFLNLLLNSWLNTDLRHFYGRSFIGILGWLDAPLPGAFYAWIGWGLAFCVMGGVCLRDAASDWAFRATTLAIAIASFVLVFFALLITWTPHPAQVIAGVQGRYFIVPAILVGYALHGSGFMRPISSNLPDTRSKTVSKYGTSLRILFLVAFAMMCMTALLSCLHTRYAL